jgi:hypothetical protein
LIGKVDALPPVHTGKGSALGSIEVETSLHAARIGFRRGRRMNCAGALIDWLWC